MTGAERRAHPRFDVDLACLVNGATEARIRNLSLGGALVVGPAGLGTINDTIAVNVTPHAAPSMSLLSDVVRVAADTDHFAYGLRFLIGSARRDELQGWLQTLTQPIEPKGTQRRRVTGSLFVDYVRMLRGQKGVDWTRYLKLEDFRFLTERVEATGWYPMETFERMGVAILGEIAKGDLSLVHMWGRLQVEELSTKHPELVAPGDPLDSMMRFQVLRNSFFDYPAVELASISDGEATAVIAYGMGAVAEEAASMQAAGFFERLLELSGAHDVQSSFSGKRWKGDPTTTLELRWT